MTADYKDCYCIKFDIPKDKSITSTDLSKSMELTLVGLENLNKGGVKNIHGDLDAVAYVEELEAGSIKVWLKDKLIGIDDSAIDDFTERPVRVTIATLLKSVRNKAIKTLNDSDPLTLEKRADLIIEEVDKVVQKYTKDLVGVIQSEGGIEINKDNLLCNLSAISQGSKILKNNVFFKESSDDSDRWQPISGNFHYEPPIECEIEPQIITAQIVLYSPVYDMTAKKWKFRLHEQVRSIDVSECSIPQMALEKGGTNFNDTFKVTLEITERKTPAGYKTDYKVVDVLECFWAGRQGNLRL